VAVERDRVSAAEAEAGAGGMTTIIYRDGVMAGDTALFDRGTYCGEVQKIYRSSDGALLGVCGCLGTVAELRDWFLGGAVGDPPEMKDQESEGLLVRADGVAEWIGPGRKRIAMTGEYFAAGSGFCVAMGALAAGSSAERAAEIACDLDSRSRRPIHVLRLHDAG
jgi:hypothetical protein